MTKRELLKMAKIYNVPPDTIDKDWVLGHFLNILFSKDWANEHLVFKGGTCLRKCFFENYRFSEDVDLTVREGNFQLTRKHLHIPVKLTPLF